MTPQAGKVEREGWLENQRAKPFRQAGRGNSETDCKESH